MRSNFNVLICDKEKLNDLNYSSVRNETLHMMSTVDSILMFSLTARLVMSSKYK